MNDVYKYIDSLDISTNDYVVAGVSGGPDSMCLLSLLIELKKVKDFKIVCAHVNHNVRKESFDEKDVVREYCEKNDVVFEYMLIEKYGDDNFHNEARTIRYNFFDDLMKKYDSKYLFMAHHGDDLVETVLMRMVRGSSLKGYAGFLKEVKVNNYSIIRPLIDVTKNDICEYLENNGINYVVDNSNFKDVYTRNRYRKYMVPVLKNEDSNVHRKFLKFSNTLLEYYNYVNVEVVKVTNEVYNNSKLDLAKFSKLDTFIQKRVIENILELFYQDDLVLISDIHTNLVLELCLSSKANSMIYLPNNVVVLKSYDRLELKYNNEVDEYEIEMDQCVLLPNGKIEKVDSSMMTSNFVCRLLSSDIKLPLIVRTRHNGDRMIIKSMKDSKKINDIFIDSKISMEERKLWPIVVDSNGQVVWLPGLKKSHFDKQNDEKYDIILEYSFEGR